MYYKVKLTITVNANFDKYELHTGYDKVHLGIFRYTRETVGCTGKVGANHHFLHGLARLSFYFFMIDVKKSTGVVIFYRITVIKSQKKEGAKKNIEFQRIGIL